MTADKKKEMYATQKQKKNERMLQKVLQRFHSMGKGCSEDQCVRDKITRSKESSSESTQTKARTNDVQVSDQAKRHKTNGVLEKGNNIPFFIRHGSNNFPRSDNHSEKYQEELYKAKKKQQTIYFKNIMEKPVFVCTCCHRMFYKKSTVLFKPNRYKWGFLVVQKALANDVREVSSDSNKYICKTCDKHL